MIHCPCLPSVVWVAPGCPLSEACLGREACPPDCLLPIAAPPSGPLADDEAWEFDMCPDRRSAYVGLWTDD